MFNFTSSKLSNQSMPKHIKINTCLYICTTNRPITTVLTKVFKLRDVSNYKKSTVRSDNITPLLRYSAYVTEQTPNSLEKHSVLTTMNCNLPPPD